MSLCRSSLSDKPTIAATVSKILIRTFRLAVLGIFIKNFVGLGEPINLQEVRVPSVLGRIALSWLLLALPVVLLPKQIRYTRIFGVLLPEVLAYPWLWVGVLSLQVVYIVVMLTLPVPGCPTGYLKAGGTADLSNFNCTGGSAALIDRAILSNHHLGHYLPCKVKYDCGLYQRFDPMGPFCTLSSVFNVFLGFIAGQVLLQHHQSKERIKRLLGWGFVELVLGVIIHFAGMPINKSLWSTSYVLVCCGISGIALVALFVTWERRPHSRGPLVWMGQNAIVLYVLSEMIEPILRSFYTHGDPAKHNLFDGYIWRSIFSQVDNQNWANFLWSLTVLSIIVFTAWRMHHNGVIIKI